MVLLLLVDAFRDHAAAFEYMGIPGFRQVPLLVSPSRLVNWLLKRFIPWHRCLPWAVIYTTT